MAASPGCCQFDSPGNDNHSNELEWGCFASIGDAPADITDWFFRDEHGWEFKFPAFVL